MRLLKIRKRAAKVSLVSLFAYVVTCLTGVPNSVLCLESDGTLVVEPATPGGACAEGARSNNDPSRPERGNATRIDRRPGHCDSCVDTPLARHETLRPADYDFEAPPPVVALWPASLATPISQKEARRFPTRGLHAQSGPAHLRGVVLLI